MLGANIIPFRPLRKVAGEAMSGQPRHWFFTYWRFIEDRDGMVASGMETGMIHGFAVIDTILADLVKA